MEKERKGTQKPYIIIKRQYYLQLEKIVNYIAYEKLEPSSALKVVTGINGILEKIFAEPTSFSECENLPTKNKIYREARCKTWLIIFKLKSNTITILGVFSGKQKPSSFKKIKNS